MFGGKQGAGREAVAGDRGGRGGAVQDGAQPPCVPAPVGGAIGLGYVKCREDGESAESQLGSEYSIDVAGTIVPAEVSFRPMYDPKSAQVRL